MTSTNPASTEYVFVYGSLKLGEPLFFLEGIKDLRLEIHPAILEDAVLYDLCPFPGLVLRENGGTVQGEVHRFQDLQTVLAILDEVEEYHGEEDPNNLYRRVEHQAELLKGKRLVSCWLYEYVGPLDGASLIESGVWRGAAVEPC